MSFRRTAKSAPTRQTTTVAMMIARRAAAESGEIRGIICEDKRRRARRRDGRAATLSYRMIRMAGWRPIRRGPGPRRAIRRRGHERAGTDGAVLHDRVA